jgi:hypothetical protein
MGEGETGNTPPHPEYGQGEHDAEELPTAALEALARALPERINADPEKVEQGLARLVLTVIELIRKVLEHQAVRRMDGGTLSEAEIETLGLALLRLEERMGELKSTFGLTDADLDIDLGPLGRLR